MDTDDMDTDDIITMADIRQNMLLQTNGRAELYKVSTVEDGHFSAALVFPPPGRTSVRRFSHGDLVRFRAPSAVLLNQYEDAYRNPYATRSGS